MSDEDKIVAFDAIAVAFTNKWHDGSWSWWNPKPCGGFQKRTTREEAVADLVEMATKLAAKKGKQ